jgi:hypothetical protein
MTPEQQREQWLKRILPALAVLVVYFVIISGFVTEKLKKAEEQYQGMRGKGIDASALPGIAQQQRDITEEVAKLEAENKAAHSALEAKSGFLARTESANDTLKRVSGILEKNRLQVLDLSHNDSPKIATLPKSLRDARQWLKDISPGSAPAVAPTATTTAPGNAGPDNKDLNIWTIRYIGTYPDNYRALLSLADSDTRALPVSLTMQAYQSNNQSNTGKQEWVLTLWL